MNDWLNEKPTRHGQAWVRRGTEDTAVYNPDTGELHLLNPSALAIWELCDGATSGAEMAEAIAELTDAGSANARDDVKSTLSRLEEHGLIRSCSGEPGESQP